MLQTRQFGVYNPKTGITLQACDAMAGMVQECEGFMARGIVGTGQGFDAPPAGRVGAKGFGGHNPNPAELRQVIIKVRAKARHSSLKN